MLYVQEVLSIFVYCTVFPREKRLFLFLSHAVLQKMYFFYRDLKSVQRGTVNRKRLSKDAVPDLSLDEKRRKLEVPVPQAN